MNQLVLFFFLGFSFSAAAQIVPDPVTGLKGYFEGWYKDAAERSVVEKRRGRLEREVVSLYLTAVNGYLNADGNRVFVERSIPPTGNYSLVQNSLNYQVVKKFPSSPAGDLYGYSSGWGAVVDSIRWDTTTTRNIEPLAIHPDRFRAPGLPLYGGKDQEIRAFLDGDTAIRKTNEEEMWREEPSKMITGQRFEWVSAWIRLIQPHWGNRWIYKSFPIVRDVVIDKRATQALFTYRTHNGGGYAHYKKTKRGWVLTESRITLMQ